MAEEETWRMSKKEESKEESRLQWYRESYQRKRKREREGKRRRIVKSWSTRFMWQLPWKDQYILGNRFSLSLSWPYLCTIFFTLRSICLWCGTEIYRPRSVDLAYSFPFWPRPLVTRLTCSLYTSPFLYLAYILKPVLTRCVW